MGAMKHTQSCKTWKRKIGINWNFGSKFSWFISSDLCHKKMLWKSLNITTGCFLFVRLLWKSLNILFFCFVFVCFCLFCFVFLWKSLNITTGCFFSPKGHGVLASCYLEFKLCYPKTVFNLSNRITWAISFAKKVTG